MKTVDSDNESLSNLTTCDSENVTDFLIKSAKNPNLINSNSDLVQTYDVVKSIPIGHNGKFYQKVLLKSNVTADSRSVSLPSSLEEKNKSNGNLDISDTCDTNTKLLPDHDSPPESPVCEMWFKTWPERYEKIRNDSSPDNSICSGKVSNITFSSGNTKAPNSKISNKNINTRINTKISDTVTLNGNATKLTLNEALQNISLAYSPVTKQLHLLENKVAKVEENSSPTDGSNEVKKTGHHRTEAGSFSSTISSLSDPSPSGSLLETDDGSSNISEDLCMKPKKKGLTNFFTRSFSWKSQQASTQKNNAVPASTVWKLFSKSPTNNNQTSPKHEVIGGSSALIQHMRPSNLPAKTEEEEQRHRDEYKAILVAAKKKEAQNSVAKQKQQKLQLQLEEQQAAAAKYFTYNVLPNWESMSSNKKTKEMWWQGLPSSVRGKIWRLAIGNDLNITQQLYEICLSRAQTRLNSPEPSQHELDFDQESSMDVIQLDIARTFPHLCIFQEGGPYSEVLHSLLAAYVCYRPDVGYVQGMSYIAAILILNMEHFDAFVCFANLLNRPLHVAAFTLNQSQMQAYYNAYNEIFSCNLPKLYAHFQNSGLTPDLYLLDWIYTIFAKAMPLDVACRVWDVFLRDGDEFIFRSALGILHLNQDVLMNMDFLHGAQFLTKLPEDLSSDQLFKSIQSVTTNIGKQQFSQIVDRCSSAVTSDC